jgi:hypothetical protein
MSGNTMPIEASERWFAGPDPEVVNAGTVPLGHISFAG